MPARTPFKKSIAAIQPEPIPPPVVVFSTLPTTSEESTPADNLPDGPSLVPDGYASSARGAVFVDLNTNRIVPPGQSAGIQLEKDAGTFMQVKTTSKRCDLLTVSTPFLDIPDVELAEIVNVRKLENGLDESDLRLIGASFPAATGSLVNSRATVSRIMTGLTDLVIHSEKPLMSLDIMASSKEILASVQESVIDLDLPCEQPNFSIEELCGIDDDASVQPSTRILSIALAAMANDGDPGSEFVVKEQSSALTKIAGKSIRFVSTMKSKSVGKRLNSKSAENPTNARDQNSIRKFSVKTPKSGVSKTLIKSSQSGNVKYKIPVTTIADRWDDLDEIIKYSERTIEKFSEYEKFALARQGKAVTRANIAAARAQAATGVGNSDTPAAVVKPAATKPTNTKPTSGVATNPKTIKTVTPVFKTSVLAAVQTNAVSKPALVGKTGRTVSRATVVSAPKISSGKAGSKSAIGKTGISNRLRNAKSAKNTGSKLKSPNNPRASSVALAKIIQNSGEKSSTRTSLIVSRLCGAISNILRREMMLTRATNAGLQQNGVNDRVTTFTRSLINTRSSVSDLSLMDVPNICGGKIISTHVDVKKSVMLLEPKRITDRRKTLAGSYETLIQPAVKFPGNSSPIIAYTDMLKTDVIDPIDQFLNIMLADVANDITPTVVFRTVMSEIEAALSSVAEAIDEDGGGVANEQIFELICMNLYADPNFKIRSKQVIYEKFLYPDKQFSFTGATGAVSSTIVNPDSKTKIKMKSTSAGKTTETVSQIETQDQTGEDDDGSVSSPGDFAADLLAVRSTLPKANYSGYNESTAASRAGTLTFQARTSEMLDSFGKSGDSVTLTQAVTTAVEKLIETCKVSIGASILSSDESELKESGLTIEAFRFMVFDLMAEICRAFYFMNLFKDTGATNYEGTSSEDPSFTVSLQTERKDRGDYLTPVGSFEEDIINVISESTGALLNVKDISSGPKVLRAVATEIQEYENDIRDHYARVFALNEIFDAVYQSFDEFRDLITSGDVSFARQQLATRQSTFKTIEKLNRKIVSDCKWRFGQRLRSIFDRSQASTQNEIDCIQQLFRVRNSIVTNDIIGNDRNSLLCAVGVPFGMTSIEDDDLQASNRIVELTVSKRDVEFQGLIFEPQKFFFFPGMKVIVSPSPSDSFGNIVEKRTQYFFFSSTDGNWTQFKYQDALKNIVRLTGTREEDARQIIRNHVIDFMSKCFFRYIPMLEYSCDNMFKSQKVISSTAPNTIISISQRLPIAPQGMTLADFLSSVPGGYKLKAGPHAIDGANEADSRLIYRLMQDPAFAGDFLTEEIFSTLPYEDIFCVVVDPDTFEVKTGSAVPAASYSSVLESLGEVTSIKDPGEGIVISTKNGKFLRQRDRLRGFSGSEIAVTCNFLQSGQVPTKTTTSKLNTKTSKFGFRGQGRRS